jgi:TPR repeat protein
VTKLRAEDMETEPDELFNRAEQLQDEGQLEDAYLLYRLAARQGHVQAALVLGTQADPAFHTADTSILTEADPQQANKWYSAAAEAGNEEAVKRLKQLRAHVEQSAADGNAAAQRLMLQWR